MMQSTHRVGSERAKGLSQVQNDDDDNAAKVPLTLIISILIINATILDVECPSQRRERESEGTLNFLLK